MSKSRSFLLSIALVLGCAVHAFAESNPPSPAPSSPPAPGATDTPPADAPKTPDKPKAGKLYEALKAHCEAQGLSKQDCIKQIHDKCEAKGLSKEQCKLRLKRRLRRDQAGANAR